MKEKDDETGAVEAVRRIRDEHARLLLGKSDEEVIEFFHRAGEAAREEARRRGQEQSPSSRP